MKTIKIGFCGSSWGSVTKESYPFKEHIENNFVVVLDNNPDYLFVNECDDSLECFLKSNKPDQIRIFFSGEALVPDFNLFDYALGFDHLQFGDRYLRLHTLTFFKRYLQYGHLFDNKIPNELLNDKTSFCDFIYSNPTAHPCRDKFFNMLSRYKKVDSLGHYLKNVESEILRKGWDGDWRSQKIVAQKKHKFSIAFENASHRGYITEKLITPMLAGSLPIYWGDPDVATYFNSESFINCHDYSSLEDVVEKVIQLDTNDDLYLEMLGKPWLTQDQYRMYCDCNESLPEFFINIFNQDLVYARRRGNGTYNSIYENKYMELFRSNLLDKKKEFSIVKWSMVKRALGKVRQYFSII